MNDNRETSAHGWFEQLVKWVESNGGKVHRQCRFRKDRTLVTFGEIDQGSCVMEIPYPILIKSDRLQLKNSIQTCNSASDCRIAAYLASRPEEIATYLKSLPDCFDLARHWSEEELNRLLGPSPLLERVRDSKRDLSRDYATVAAALESTSFSREQFDQALAAVSSRAFDHGGVSTMVPLLDLCNHTRGSRSKKNISYAFDDNRHMVVVTAVASITANEVLQITYGAQANGPLLLNYGFCIEPNSEPDGSSNDTYELWHNGSVVHLRIGPKAYTYGCLSSALEMFLTVSDSAGFSDSDGPPDDMDAFLDSCEQESEGFGSFDEDEAVDDNEESDAEEFDDQREKGALQAFSSVLDGLRSGYKDSFPDDNTDHSQFASILQRSESKTIYFYQLVVRGICKELKHGTLGAVEKPNFICGEQHDRTLSHVNELVFAYMQIRHPGSLV